MVLWSVRSSFHRCKYDKTGPRDPRVIVEDNAVPFLMEHRVYDFLINSVVTQALSRTVSEM